MTPAATLQALRVVGGALVIADGQIRLRAPRGAVPDHLRESLRVHRDALLAILVGEARDHRRRLFTRGFSDLNDRMSALGPWTRYEVAAVHELADQVDLEARAFIAAEVADPSRFESTLESWEAALRAAKGHAGARLDHSRSSAPAHAGESRESFPGAAHG